MRIVRATTRLVRLPLDNRLVVGLPPRTDTREFVTLELGTDQGWSGSASRSSAARFTRAEARRGRAGAAHRRRRPDPDGAIAAKLRAPSGSAGPGGIFTLALSAIDMACWDLKGKAAGQSVCALLGGLRDRAPTYASGALMRPHPVDYLAKAGPRLVEHGLPPDEDAVRQRADRRGVGRARARHARGDRPRHRPHVRHQPALERAPRHRGRPAHRADYQLFWLEDPTAHDDYPGLARIADALDTPIAAGEYHYGIVPFRHLLEARSIDIVMIDLLRVGGITQWMKVAGMAEAFNLPVVSHLIPEIHVHLIAAIPNGLTVEYMPWTRALVCQALPPIEDGMLVVPDEPGFGLEFDAAVIRGVRGTGMTQQLEELDIGELTANRVRIEPTPRWVRAFVGGEKIADSKRVLLVFEPRRLPVYYFPIDDVRIDLLKPSDYSRSAGERADDALESGASAIAASRTSAGVTRAGRRARAAQGLRRLLLGQARRVVRGGRGGVRPSARPAQTRGRHPELA